MFEAGIASWICEEEGAVEALRRIARHGFRQVELWCNYAHLDPRLGGDVALVKRVLGEERLRPVSLHAPYEFRGARRSTEVAWGAWEELMSRILEIGGYLGVGFVVVHPVLLAVPHGPPRGEPEVMAGGERVLKRVARAAQRLGIRVALENLQMPTAPAFATPSGLAELVRSLNEGNVGICFDTGHCLLSGLDPLGELERCSAPVFSLHLHENDGTEDSHCVPGGGRIDWPRFLSLLRARKYGGAFILEVWGGADAGRVMQDARRFVERHHLTGAA